MRKYHGAKKLHEMTGKFNTRIKNNVKIQAFIASNKSKKLNY